MKLAWDAPASEAADRTDDFERYEAWGTDFGDWTTVDNDHGYAGGLIEGARYQHQGEQFAFINWQPADIFESSKEFNAHSGGKAAVAIYQVDESANDYVDADNWLISPQLSGKAQTVRFWVNNLKAQDASYGTENFDVLVSETDNDTAHFVKKGDTYVQASGEWTEISVDVPEGTKFFAIHHITGKNNVFVFMVDDATFETGSGPISYNIYRDGVCIGSSYKVTSDEMQYDNAAHKYSVTAVYADGAESQPVEIDITTAIQKVNANGEVVYDVYTIDGKQLLKGARSLGTLAKGIYIVNGRKTVIR